GSVAQPVTSSPAVVDLMDDTAPSESCGAGGVAAAADVSAVAAAVARTAARAATRPRTIQPPLFILSTSRHTSTHASRGRLPLCKAAVKPPGKLWRALVLP